MLQDNLNTTPPDILYHYTTQDGLLGIVKDCEIWATHFKYLNDKSEIYHAVELAKKIISSKISKSESGSIESEILTNMKQGLSWSSQFSHSCVISFTSEDDDLSQWRAYGGNNGAYAIGFNSFMLKKFAESYGYIIAPVEYDADKQNSLMTKLIESALSEYVEFEENHPGRSNSRVYGSRFGLLLASWALLFKHNSFEKEREWRIILNPIKSTRRPLTPKVDYRVGKSTIVPYRKLKFDNQVDESFIAEIVVGPNPKMEEAIFAVQSLLNSSSKFGFSITKESEIPYRGW